MATRNRLIIPSTLYVELRRSELAALAVEDRHARQAMAGQHLRHRLGHLLIGLGERLSERRIAPAHAESCAVCSGHGALRVH